MKLMTSILFKSGSGIVSTLLAVQMNITSEKGDFIELLEKNNITYLLQETLFCGFKHYTDSEVSNDDAGEIPRDLALDFIASGLTTIAKHYVKNRNAITCERLEVIIYSLFSGAF